MYDNLRTTGGLCQRAYRTGKKKTYRMEELREAGTLIAR